MMSGHSMMDHSMMSGGMTGRGMMGGRQPMDPKAMSQRMEMRGEMMTAMGHAEAREADAEKAFAHE